MKFTALNVLSTTLSSNNKGLSVATVSSVAAKFNSAPTATEVPDTSRTGTARPQQPGRAIEFDGVNDYVDFGNPSQLQITGRLTVSAWIKTTTNSNDGIATKYTASGSDRAWGIQLVGGSKARFYYQSVGGTFNANQTIDSVTDVNTGEWVHILATYNPSTFTGLYINGVLDISKTTSVPSAINDTAANFLIGALDTNYFDGQIKDVRVYSKSLTADEVTHVYTFGAQGTDPTATNLVGQWKMDEGAGDTAYDSSGNNNDGTLTNSPTRYEGSDVPYSYQNEVGYTYDAARDLIIPRNEKFPQYAVQQKSILLDTYDYYVDPVSGSDSNSGTSPSQSWATLTKLHDFLDTYSGSNININIASATYTNQDLNLGTFSGEATLYFEPDATIQWTLGTDNSGIQQGNVGSAILRAYGNGCRITGFNVGTGNGLGANNGSLYAYDFNVDDCVDGCSGHGTAYVEIHRCHISNCSKGGIVHVNSGGSLAQDCTVIGKSGASTGTVFGDNSGHVARNCIIIPDGFNASSVGCPNKTAAQMFVFENCQIGTENFYMTTSGADMRDCYVNGYVQLNQHVALTRSYGKFALRLRAGGSFTCTNSVITGSFNGQFIYTDYNPGSYAQVTVTNSIITGLTSSGGAVEVDQTYWQNANSTIDNCAFFGNTANFNSGANNEVGASITNISTTDPGLGSATGFEMKNYTVPSGTIGFLAAQALDRVFPYSLDYTGKVPRNGLLKQSTCLSFDGTNDYVDLTEMANVVSKDLDHSGSLRFKADITSGNYAIISSTKSASDRFVISIEVNVLKIGVWNGATYAVTGAAFTDTAGWHTLTWDYTSTGHTITGTLDGVETASVANPGTSSTVGGRVGSLTSGGSPYNGSVANVVIGSTINLPFSEGAGATAHDVSGNDNHGTLINSPTWAKQDVFHYNITKGFDHVGTFDGVNDYIDFGSSAIIPTSGNFEIEAYVQLNSLGINQVIAAQYVANTSGVGSNRTLFRVNPDDNIELFLGSGGAYSTQLISGSTTLTTGTTYKFKATKIGAVYTVYIDDVVEVSFTDTDAARPVSNVGFIAGSRTSSTTTYDGSQTEFFDGSIFRLRVSDGSTDILFAPLSENSGTNVPDTSGNNNNGTLNGDDGSKFWAVKVPVAADGSSLTGRAVASNPAAAVHNGAETQIDFTGGVAAPWTSKVYKGHAEFNGADYITILESGSNGDNPIELDGDLEIKCTLSANTSHSAYVINNYQDSSNDHHILLHIDPQGSGIAIKASIDDDSNPTTVASGELSLNQEYAVKLVRDKGSTVKLFIDDIEVDSSADVTTGSIASNRDWVFGKRAESPDIEFFNGTLRDVQFYNDDVLIGEWNLSSGTLDSSGNNNHGTNNGVTFPAYTVPTAYSFGDDLGSQTNHYKKTASTVLESEYVIYNPGLTPSQDTEEQAKGYSTS